jgi:hypothetical protein
MSAVALSLINLKITELDPETYNCDAHFSSFSYSARTNAEISSWNVVDTGRFLFPQFSLFNPSYSLPLNYELIF